MHGFVQYLVSDLYKQNEDDENEQIIEDANSSNDDVDDLESKVTEWGYVHTDKSTSTSFDV